MPQARLRSGLSVLPESARPWALLARSRGDEVVYRNARDRYREMATPFGFEGHVKYAAAIRHMLAGKR